MRDIEYLATAINKIIGENDFIVYLNTNVAPNFVDDRTVVTLSARRDFMGMPSEDLDVETLTVTLTFNLPAENDGEDLYVRDRAFEIIHNRLLGEKNFNIEIADGTIYKATSLLAQEQPSDPFIDAGRATQLIVLTGTIYVANANCKAMVGNDVNVYIGRTVGIGKDQTIEYERLLHTNRSLTYQSAHENFLYLTYTSKRVGSEAVSFANTKSLSFIYTGKAIEDRFLKIAEGMSLTNAIDGLGGNGPNTTLTYKCEYPHFTITVPFKIISVNFQDANGVLLQYTLTIQTVGDASIVTT